MGCSSSKPDILPVKDGDGKDFLEKYAVGKILGSGEFGVVKLVYLKNDPVASPFACKMLRKGMQFKDNTLYSAIKPKVLRLECMILKTLGGQHYNLNLEGLYESSSTIYIVTDYCPGGDMFQYISQVYGKDDLRTEDVSRISFQLLDAISHCAKYGIIHRDIKPENIMFKSLVKGAPLQLIDFGSGTMASDVDVQIESKPKPEEQYDGSILDSFTTFAGSAFYISPEMFQRRYTVKTDVWSAGVTIYVLVAGYPSKDLQKAFNRLQEDAEPNKRIETLKDLPNMPKEMSSEFFDMLGQLLIVKAKHRVMAKDILKSDFIRFHMDHSKQMTSNSLSGGKSFVVTGAANAHIQKIEYVKFERSVSTLLATMLIRTDLKALLAKIDVVITSSPLQHSDEMKANKKRLQIIKIQDLINILNEMKLTQVSDMIRDQAHGSDYLEFAYHVALLRQFYTDIDDTTPSITGGGNGASDLDTSMNRKMKIWMDKKNHVNDSSLDNSSQRSEHGSSVHGSNVWGTLKKQMETKQKLAKWNRGSTPDLLALNQSAHV